MPLFNTYTGTPPYYADTTLTTYLYVSQINFYDTAPSYQYGDPFNNYFDAGTWGWVYRYPDGGKEYRQRTAYHDDWFTPVIQSNVYDYHEPAEYFFAVYDGELLFSLQPSAAYHPIGLGKYYGFPADHNWGAWRGGINAYWVSGFTAGSFHTVLGLGEKVFPDPYFTGPIGVF